ncbi:hypothetical protein CI109_106124 [Kwoniella shandongensis]|uniref:Xylanolytic transcriptional activator regulatory domain-containing protein n=1 Tax=Kwoniella shandongensis TaxID=1734106 RepID=A0AAJ8MZN1_9TREE
MQQQNDWQQQQQQRRSQSASVPPPPQSSNDDPQTWYTTGFNPGWQQDQTNIPLSHQSRASSSNPNVIQPPPQASPYLQHHQAGTLRHASSNQSSLGGSSSTLAGGGYDSDDPSSNPYTQEDLGGRKPSTSSLLFNGGMDGAGQTAHKELMEGTPHFAIPLSPMSIWRPQNTSLHPELPCEEESELSDFVHQGAEPGVPSAFSSQPLAYDVSNNQINYGDYSYPTNVPHPNPNSLYTLSNNVLWNDVDPSLRQIPFPAASNFPVLSSQAEYNPYPGDINQPLLNSYVSPHEPTGATFQQFGEPGTYLGLSNDPSPSIHHSTLPPQAAQFNPVLGGDFPSVSPAVIPYDALGLQSGVAPMTLPNSTPTPYPFPHEHNQPTPTMPLQAQLTHISSSAASTSPKPSNPPTGASSTPSGSTPGSTSQLPPMFIEAAALRYTSDIESSDPVDGLTERLGEFLFSPQGTAASPADEGEWKKKRRTAKENAQWTSGGRVTSDIANRSTVFQSRVESDGLRDDHRNLLLDCFLAHCRLFFEMSVPRFRYRMTFNDRRRPSLALLNAMYLWATRMSNAPNVSAMEHHFFSAACRYLDSAGPNSDRLIDAVRAAMLLSAYSYTNGRHHEGWLIAGLAVRLVFSTGLHQIHSLTFKPNSPPENPFLRNRKHLLPPPEDAIELAERVHAFWCVYAIERCGALATGFPSAIRDEDITTPFGRPFDDIASQSVTQHDDITIRDLYRGVAHPPPGGDSAYVRWVKAVTLLERASKLAFLEPADDSEYSTAWTAYASNLNSTNGQKLIPPPAWLNQPKYRNPKDYNEVKYGLEKFMESLGVDGISPLERQENANVEGATQPVITSHTIQLHHQFAATEMLLHDVNSPDAENTLALIGARKSIDIFRNLPPLAPHEVDAQNSLVWSMIAKVVIKELHRCAKIGDAIACQTLEADVETIINELHRVGTTMHLSRTQANTMEELKKAALAPLNGSSSSDTYAYSTGDDELRH